jgi:ligand-binding sensor domain-containing protein
MKRTGLILMAILLVAFPVFSQNDIWTTYTESDGLVSNFVYAIAIDDEGNKWFGTSKGISRFNDSEWKSYDIQTTVNHCDSHISSVAIDNEGNKWFGSDGTIIRFKDPIWINYNEEINSDLVGDIVVDSMGNIWAAAQTLFGAGGVYVYDGKNWNHFFESTALANAIAIDDEGNKWVGFEGNGVARFNDTIWTYYTIEDGLVSNEVWDVAVDLSGNKWFATYAGVSKYDGINWISYTTEDGLVSNIVHAIEIDDEGNIWFGTGEGVSKFDGTNWTNYTKEDGLISLDVRAIAIDDEGDIWFGTMGGVSKLSEQETSVKEGEIFSSIKIYPNPTNAFLTIETEYSDQYSVEITSLNGQLILDRITEGPTHQIDLSSFQKGVYFITIRSKDIVTTKKIIKL